MKIIIFLITILTIVSAKSQNIEVEIHLTKDSDTAFWKKSQADIIKEFNLPELNFKSDFVFRSWSPGSLLEITKDNDSIGGKIIYFVFEAWEDDYKADIFVKTYLLPSSISNGLYDYISKSEFQNIPSDKFIENWQHGFDGITHIYELKMNNTYSFKRYWTPTAQKGIQEAEFIIDFNKKIAEIGEIEKYGKDFNERIPFLSYKYSGTAYVISKTPNKRELRKYKRERRKKMKNGNK